MDKGEQEESHADPVDNRTEECVNLKFQQQFHYESRTPAEEEKDDHADQHLDHLFVLDFCLFNLPFQACIYSFVHLFSSSFDVIRVFEDVGRV